MTTLDPVRQELFETDESFRLLFNEHQDCEHRLDAIRAKSLPSEDDEMEVKRIKLHKLALKDRMESIVRGHRVPAHA